MARPKRFRVDGPYPHHRRWRIRLVHPDGRVIVASFATEAKARLEAEEARRQLPDGATFSTAVASYILAQRERGLRPGSVLNCEHFLRSPDNAIGGRLLAKLTADEIRAWYRARAEQVAAATHHEELRMVKRCLRHAVRAGLLKVSVAELVEPMGRAKRGKPQLRVGEAQRFYASGLRLAAHGDAAAMGATLALAFGLRSGEVTGLVVRDVDCHSAGATLWVEGTKTERAKRHLAIPSELLRPLQAFTSGKLPGASLLEAPTSEKERRRWLSNGVKRVCLDAGVPVICPQGLRGTHATLAEESGVAAQAVVRSLGHSSHATTAGHYLAHGTVERVRSAAVLTLVAGTGIASMQEPAGIPVEK